MSTAPVIQSIAIQGYQSLYDVSIDLSPFTVLVGPSSTGKSAFIRACRLLLQNQRGQNFISHGEDQASVTAIIDGHAVAIHRGKRNEYALHIDQGPAETYTKLGGDVPEDVKNFLGIDPSLSVASQFDPPFLLTSSSTEVARTLGSLTNVDVIHGASREASRLRLGSNARAKALQETIEADRQRLQQYDDLQERIETTSRAETVLQQAKDAGERYAEARMLQDAVQMLAGVVQGLKVVEVPASAPGLVDEARALAEKRQQALDMLDAFQARVRAYKSATVRKVPEVDLDALRAAQRRLEASQALLQALRDQRAVYKAQSAIIEASERTLQVLAQSRLQILAEAGVCPTCGQSTCAD